MGSKWRPGKLEGGAVDDAVKILFYMTERTKAKLLAEMVTSGAQAHGGSVPKVKENSGARVELYGYRNSIRRNIWIYRNHRDHPVRRKHHVIY